MKHFKIMWNVMLLSQFRTIGVSTLNVESYS